MTQKFGWMMMALVGTLLVVGGAAAQSVSFSMPERGLCAHRGANRTHPENTLGGVSGSDSVGGADDRV